MNNKINYGVILAGGSASRLHPLSKYFPKITLPVFDNPLVIHHFNIMKSVGIRKVFIVVSEYNYDIISAILSKVDDLDIEYEFVIQDVPNGTGHALWLLKDHLNDSRFLLLLGDEYYNDISSFNKIIDFDEDENILGIVEYHEIKNILTGCNVILNDNCITRLTEKPKEEEIIGKWCWDGSIVLNKNIFKILDNLYEEFQKGKQKQICIVKALQLSLEENIRIRYFKKHCANINITYDLDLMKASFIECTKKYDRKEVLESLEKLS